MIDRIAYNEVVIRCLLLEAEVQALREHTGPHKAARAQSTRVVYLRDELRLSWAGVGKRLGISPEGARKRYYKAITETR